MLARIAAIVVLILLNGYFVAAEFALVRSRRTRLEAMIRRGARFARLVLRATTNISALISASQLGVTLSSLGVGWVTQLALRDALGNGAVTPLVFALAVVAAIAAAAFAHVVFGELVPKAVALQHPERLAQWLLPGLMTFAWLTRPAVWLVARTSDVILRTIGVERTHIEESVHSPEELRILVEQAQEGGAIEAQDAEMLDAVLDFSEKTAREVMTPRTDIVGIPIDSTLEEVLRIVEETGFSRYPVHEETMDSIVGILLTRELLRVVRDPQEATFDLRSMMRPAHVVPGARLVEDVLADFKRLKEHMAVVVDEYGGTAGIVTMEDLLEEIVGEILDEYDEAEPEARSTGYGEALVPGVTSIADVNEQFGLSVPEEGYTTIGGYVFGTLGRLPAIGDRVVAGGAIFTVAAMEGRRIESLAVDLHTLGDRRETPREEPAPRTEASPQ